MKPFLKCMFVLASIVLWGTARGVAGPARVGAATITVCPGGCDHATLQGAINSAASGDTIMILMTTALTESDIVVNKDITIEGLDREQTIVQAAAMRGTANARVFTILSGHAVTMRTFTIRHGRVTNDDGGGIWVQAGGWLALDQMVVSLNEAQNGGGIATEGTLTLRAGSVQDNDAVSRGGGLFSTGSLTITSDSRIRNNDAASGAGIAIDGGSVALSHAAIVDNDGIGLLLYNGSMSLRDVAILNNRGFGLSVGSGTVDGARLSIQNNVEQSLCGGGIRMVGDGELVLRESAIVNNDADTGGGICQLSANSAAYLTNVSLINNAAGKDGGGIYAGDGLLWLANVTVAENRAGLDDPGAYAGGGIYIVDGDVHLRSTIVADNGGDTDYPDCYGSFQTATFSLIGDLGQLEPRCGWLGYSSGMLSDVDPHLDGAIAAGHTSGVELQAASPAIDSGLCVSATGPAPETDQRGYVVPWDGDGDGEAYCDMGAFEYGSEPANNLYLPLVTKPTG